MIDRDGKEHWISTEDARQLLGIKRSRFFELQQRVTTRAAGKAANGKPTREILLESLPIEFQSRYLNSLAPEREAENPVAIAAPTAGAGGTGEGNGAQAPAAAALLAELGEAKLDELNRKAERLREIAASKRPRQLKAQTAHDWGVDRRTVERYYKAFSKDGVAGLLRKQKPAHGPGSQVADIRVVARIQSEYLKTYQPRVTQIYRAMVKDYEMSGKRALSYSTVRRITQQIAPDLIAKLRIGEKYADDKFAYITLRKKPALPRQWTVADHHECDHYVIFADGSIGRPWLTAIQDISTNEILGYVLTHEKRSIYPGANAIALTMRRAILKKEDKFWPSCGIFEKFYVDLGKDFRSQHVRAICHDLSIEIVHTRGYHGKSKPIERWFGVMEDQLRHLPGYCGKDYASNPERQRLGAPRSFEDMRGELLTIDRFETALHEWIVKDFHHAGSKALQGISPLEALAAHVKTGWAPREVANERALDLLLMRRQTKTVQRMGVQMFSTRECQRFFFAPELLPLIGQDVEVFYDPAKIGEVIIYKDNRFVCNASNRELLSYDATIEDLQREIKRKQREGWRARQEEMLKQAQHPDALKRAIAEQRREEVMDEEWQKIAVGAKAQGVSTLLPKYAGAAKKLSAAPVSKIPVVQREKNPWLEEDLRSSEEIFKPDINPWLLEEDYSKCPACGTEAQGSLSLHYCPCCSKSLCGDCGEKHARESRNNWIEDEDL